MSVAGSPLAAAQDEYPFACAVQMGDTAIDFERFAESVDCMCDELTACGVSRGSRVAVVMCDGIEAVLTWHALVYLGSVIIPVDLCDGRQVDELHGDRIDCVLAPARYDEILEDLAEYIGAQDSPCPLFCIGDEFTVLDVTGGTEHDHDEGPRVSTVASSGETAESLLAEACAVACSRDYWPGARIEFDEDLSIRSRIVTTLASAASGACLNLDASSIQSGPN
ncbi:hypothetical protein GOEFS_092_00700 [Gordonia effusa NBRC 100432]|uniref:AMP-dependent synthetase/ligase domain-containing protein n=1 Tax=Gordonia effusa NBRC 100432 TaxID=1077974 RepID=H0R3J4_9ACTN|nr:AMP-binding protein [Gordonia effusa]GAB19645.1 hypothetical protein GOEFS_092_00700 [Gordonia effusa NBRC 100432]